MNAVLLIKIVAIDYAEDKLGEVKIVIESFIGEAHRSAARGIELPDIFGLQHRQGGFVETLALRFARSGPGFGKLAKPGDDLFEGDRRVVRDTRIASQELTGTVPMQKGDSPLHDAHHTMGEHAAFVLIEENVATLHHRCPEWRHRDQLPVFNRRLHACSNRPEPDAIPAAQQLCCQIRK